MIHPDPIVEPLERTTLLLMGGLAAIGAAAAIRLALLALATIREALEERRRARR